jgi:hypothetical protein
LGSTSICVTVAAICLLVLPSAATAAQDSPGTDEITSEWVQGQTRITGYPDFGETTMIDEARHLQELRGRVYEGIVEAGDPRVAGTSTGTLNQDTHLLPADWVFPAVSEWGTERIENEGGAWESIWSGGDMAFGQTQSVSWCDGVDGYEGYAMRMILTKSLETGGSDFVGLVWPGELPPLPAPR